MSVAMPAAAVSAPMRWGSFCQPVTLPACGFVNMASFVLEVAVVEEEEGMEVVGLVEDIAAGVGMSYG